MTAPLRPADERTSSESVNLTLQCGNSRRDTVFARIVDHTKRSTYWIEVPRETIAELTANDPEGTTIRSLSRNRLDERGLLPGGIVVEWRALATEIEVKTPLTKREADVYVLSHLFDLDRSEIASTLGISPNTVDNHLRNVRDIETKMSRLVVDTIRLLDLSERVIDVLPMAEYHPQHP